MSAIQQLLTDHIDIWTAAETEKKSGRGRTSGNAGSVYGVRKLRELILELAVRGKLVPQDANDEPASELLKRIQSEKAKLIAEGKIKKDKPLAAITEDEKPFALPNGWKWVRLGHISGIERGGSPRPIKSFITNDPDGFNWIKIGDTDQGGKYITSTDEKIRKDGLSSTRMVYPGDFLLTNSMSFGRPYITKIEGCIHDGWLRISPPEALDKDYLYLLLSSPYVRRMFVASAAGAVVQNLNSEKVRDLLIPIMPSAEQHRIVAKVDELMVLCDQLENQHSNAAEAHEKLVSHLLGTLTQSQNAEDFSVNWQRIAAHFDTLFTTDASIDALKQTLLQLAVMGKLVPQDENDEPASELLKRIQAEKAKLIAEGMIKKDKPLPPITEDEKPFDLPKGWEWVRLGNLMPEYQNGASSRGDSDGSPVVVLRLADIKDRSISLAEPRELIISPSMIEKYRLSLGDILVVRVNGSADLVGGFVVCEQNFDGIYCDHFIRMRISQKIFNPKFLALVGASQLVRDRIKDLFITTAGQKTVNQGHIGSLMIPLLGVAEQNSIVTKVDELMALCDQLKFRITNADRLQQKLADVLVEQAVA